MIRTRFNGIYRLDHIMINWPRITCRVKRWRPETHVPVEEITITLRDVAIILGLHIHEPAITGTCVFDVAELCGELLGVTPPVDILKGSSISIRWLRDQLSTSAPDVDEVTLERSAVTPRTPARPDWRIRTGFRDARLRTGTLYLIFFFFFFF